MADVVVGGFVFGVGVTTFEVLAEVIARDWDAAWAAGDEDGQMVARVGFARLMAQRPRVALSDERAVGA